MKIGFERLAKIADDLEKVAKKHKATSIEMDLGMGILVYRIAHKEGHCCERDQILQRMIDAGQVEIEDLPEGKDIIH